MADKNGNFGFPRDGVSADGTPVTRQIVTTGGGGARVVDIPRVQSSGPGGGPSGLGSSHEGGHPAGVNGEQIPVKGSGYYPE